jgi:hypothetical protein
MSATAARPAPAASAASESIDGPSTREVLLRLLQGAAAAHGAYEADVLGGEFDAEWPEWYSSHMTDAFLAEGYRLVHEVA